jgi:hypothetical protein
MSSTQHRHHDRPAWSFIHRGDDVAGYSLRTCLRACSRLLSLTFGIAQVTAFNGEGLLSTHATSNSMHLSTIVTNSNHLSNNCHDIQSTSGFKMCVARLVYRMRMRRPSQLRDQQSITRTCASYLHLDSKAPSATPSIRPRVVELCSDTSMMSA